MKFLRQSLVGVFLAALTLALLIYSGQVIVSAVQERMSQEVRPPQAQERVFAVNLQTARPETVTPILEAFGEVQSRRTLELRAASQGRVTYLAESFVEGGTVTAGELLMQVDPADAEGALDRAQSDMLDAEAEVRDADRGLILARDELEAARDQSALRERAYQRQLDLSDRGVGTATTVESAELAAAQARQSVLASRMSVAQAEARVDQAQTTLARARVARRTAERDLEDTRLTAPYDGTLSEVTLVEGRLVQLNERIASLVDPEQLEVAFRISTAQYVRLLDEDGSLLDAPVRVSLNIAGVDLMAEGRISRDSAAVGEGQSGRLLFARLGAAPGFKPGDFVTVHVEEPPLDNIVRLPASVLDAGGTVLVLQGEDRLDVLPVTLVRRQGDAVLLRGAGLAGREVVVGRTQLLGPGIRVRPIRNEAADTGAEQQAEAGTSARADAAPDGDASKADTPVADRPDGDAQPDGAVDLSSAVPGNQLSIGPSMLKLSDERRARLVAFVTDNKRMPEDVKARLLGALQQDEVPEPVVQRIESRMGG
ncbi:efflux RND transporter periplasmic adaptor subunit [Marinibacterium profundimaris]|uniref:Hemolysin D n=1 Tax=Marinibacterium profundimaris TaxID=1679460 RepID=A0A225NI17_9RHOB|nr:HlyD family efflux transporter periplasmic adaptor subunit [Marinibacterium profundimaris]OWU73384.1 hemolysin D [Marinibacterium profundimaris]